MPNCETGYADQVGAGGTPRLTIANGGNVGIGITSPEATLHLGSGALKIGTRLIADGTGSYYAP